MSGSGPVDSRAGTPEQNSLMIRLERVYNLYQQQHVYDRLNQIATEMEDTILQVTIADSIFEEPVEISDEAKETVADVQSRLQQSTEDAERQQTADITIDKSDIDEMEQVVTAEEERVEARIHELRAPQASTVEAMELLNEEVEVTDKDQLAVLSTLLSDWNWRTHVPETDSFEEKQAAMVEFASEMDAVLAEARAKLGAGFTGQNIEEIVETLLSGDQMSLQELESTQVEALLDSELGNYLTISLG